MKKNPLFKTGDFVRLDIDGMQYVVRHVTNANGAEPGERMYFLVLRGRWPWQTMKTCTVPETVMAKSATLMPALSLFKSDVW